MTPAQRKELAKFPPRVWIREIFSEREINFPGSPTFNYSLKYYKAYFAPATKARQKHREEYISKAESDQLVRDAVAKEELRVTLDLWQHLRGCGHFITFKEFLELRIQKLKAEHIAILAEEGEL